MPTLWQYLRPKRKLYNPPRHVTAQYNPEGITLEQEIIMRAGKARDPQAAQAYYEKLTKKHGDKVWHYLEFEVRRAHTETITERIMKLIRKIFGESERPAPVHTIEDNRVDYRVVVWNKPEDV